MLFGKYVLPALLVVVPVAILMTRRSRPSPSSYVLDPGQRGSDFGVVAPDVTKIARWFKPDLRPDIVLDPGHGGSDSGVVAPDGTKEKDLNLALSLILKEYLMARGYRVGITRTEDVYLSSSERIKKAMEMGAYVFMSVHHGAPTATRFGVYYSPDPLSFALARKVQAALGPGTWILPSSASRFGRLYIDDFPGPAVLIEFGPTRSVSREEQIALARAVASLIAEWNSRAVV